MVITSEYYTYCIRFGQRHQVLAYPLHHIGSGQLCKQPYIMKSWSVGHQTNISCACVRACHYVYAWVKVRACIFECVRNCVGVRMCVRTCVVYARKRAYVRNYVCLRVYIRLSLFVHMSVFYMFKCVRAYVVCVRACVCLYIHVPLFASTPAYMCECLYAYDCALLERLCTPFTTRYKRPVHVHMRIDSVLPRLPMSRVAGARQSRPALSTNPT